MKKLLSTVLGAAALLLGACAQPGGYQPDPARTQVVVDLGVEVAVIRFLEQYPDRAQDVRDTAALVGAMLEGGDFATVSAIQGEVDSRIADAGFTPTEVALARAVVQLVAQDIGKVTGGSDAITPEVKTKIVHYLAIVQRAAIAPGD